MTVKMVIWLREEASTRSFGSDQTHSGYSRIYNIFAGARTQLFVIAEWFSGRPWPCFKRASAPLYSRGVIVIDCTLIHTAQCTSPARASVLNQRPTKMEYTRPFRGQTIDRTWREQIHDTPTWSTIDLLNSKSLILENGELLCKAGRGNIYRRKRQRIKREEKRKSRKDSGG